MGSATDRHFRLLCERVIERPELVEDERFATNTKRVANRAVLVALLEEIFRSRDAAVWVARCREVAIPVSLVQGVLEALRSEPARHLVGTIGTLETVRHPVRFDGERLPLRGAPPALGEQTTALRRELTRDDTERRNRQK